MHMIKLFSGSNTCSYAAQRKFVKFSYQISVLFPSEISSCVYSVTSCDDECYDF